MVDRQTRGSAVLDKIITIIPSQYQLPIIMVPLGRSDHSIVLCNPKINAIYCNETHIKTIRPLKQSFVREFGQWITQYDWSEVFAASGTQQKTDIFYSVLNDAINTYFPSKSTKLHITDKPWMTVDIKSLIKQRQILFSQNNLRWKLIRNKIIRLITTAKKDCYHNRIQRLKCKNPATWYRTIKMMTSGTTSDPTIIPPSGVDRNDELAIANTINKFFLHQWLRISIPWIYPHCLPIYHHLSPVPQFRFGRFINNFGKFQVGKQEGQMESQHRLFVSLHMN